MPVKRKLDAETVIINPRPDQTFWSLETYEFFMFFYSKHVYMKITDTKAICINNGKEINFNPDTSVSLVSVTKIEVQLH